MFRRQLLRLGAASLSLGVASASVSLASCQELKLPPVGLGLWKSSPGEVHAAVRSALRAGYTLLDGAAAYGNEKEVGAALAAAVADGDVRREDVWVVSKLFNTHHVWQGDRTRPHAGLAKTLAELGVEKLDLYLMHWPFAFRQTDLKAIGGLRLTDGTPNPQLEMEMEYLDTWGEMIKMKEAGLVAHLGVCNFTVEQLRKLAERYPDATPEVNQVELHPYLAQPELAAYCRQHGIALMAYSPLGSADSYSGQSFPAKGAGTHETPRGGATLLQNEVVGEIARRLGRTPAQVLLRWSLQSGFVPLPKSVNEERIRANADVVSWELTADDMAKLAELDCGFRYSIGYRTGHYDVSQPTSRRPARPRLSATQTARRRAQTVRGREPRNPAPAKFRLSLN